MNRIVRGNDFMLRVPLARSVNGVTEAFDLSQCTDVTMSICNNYKRIPLAFHVDDYDTHVLMARIEGDLLPLGVFSLEVKGKKYGDDWRVSMANVFEVVPDSTNAGLDGDGTIEIAVTIISPDHLGNVASKAEVTAVRKAVKKKQNRKAMVVCRKAISLGATAANGNLVKYFSCAPQLRLLCGVPYRIHVNGTILGDEEIGVYSANILNTQITTGGGNVISVQGEEGAGTACVNISSFNSNEVAKVTWVEKEEKNNGVCDVYLKMKTVDNFSCDTPSHYFRIVNSQIKGIIQDVKIPLMQGDLMFIDIVGAGKVLYYMRRSCIKNSSDRKNKYGYAYRFRKIRSNLIGTRGGRILAVVRRKGKVICKKEFSRWYAPTKQEGERYFAKEIGC